MKIYWMKHLAVLCVCIACCINLDAQKLSHGLGTHLSISQYKKEVNPFWSLAYAARLNVHEKEDFSVSLDVPVTVGIMLEMHGFGGFMSEGESSENTRWLISVPLTANLNWGAGSIKNNPKKLGYFVGGGMGYFYDAGSMYYKDDKVINGIAATAQAGLRIGMGKKRRRNIEIKLTGWLPVQQTNVPHFGLGGMLNL